MNLLRLSVFIFLLCGQFSLAHSQEQIFEKLRYEDGLPEAEYYNIVQDSAGYYWIASDRGLIRYDGNDYKLYNVENGLSENTVLRVWNYGPGRLLLAMYNDLFWIFENNSFREHPINEMLRTNDGHDLRSESLKGDTVLIGLRRKIVGCDLNGNQVTFGDETCDEPSWDIKSRESADKLSYIVSTEGSDVTFCLRFGVDNPYPDSLLQIGPNLFSIRLKNEYLWKDWRISSMNKTDSFLVLSKDSLVFSWNLKTGEYLGTKQLHTRIHSADVHKQKIVLGTMSGYLLFDPTNLETEDMYEFLTKEMTTSSIEDKEGNTWITTTTNGIYKIPYPGLERLHTPEMRYCTYLGPGLDGSMLVVANKYELIAFKEGQKLWSYRSTAEIRDVRIVGRDYYLSIGTILREDGSVKEKFSSTVIANHIQWYKDIPILDVNEHLIRFNKDKTTKSIFWTRRIYCSSIYDDGLILGSADGLLLLQEDWDSLRRITTNTMLDSVKVTDILDYHGRLYISTSEAGIFVLNPENHQVLAHWWSKTGFPSNNVNKMLAHKGLFYTSTSKGVYAFTDENRVAHLKGFLNRSNGFPAGETRDIFIKEGSMYVSTSTGLISCPLNSIKRQVQRPQLFLQGLRINQVKNPLQSSLDLKHYENNLQVDFNSILLARVSDQPPFRYALVSSTSPDTIWNYIRTKTIQLLDLHEGNHRLVIQASDNYSRFGAVSIELPIHIQTRLINRLWFRLLVIFLILSYVFYYVSMRIKTKRKQDEEKMEFMRIEIEALKSQINPHFLFNSLYVAQAITKDSETKQLKSYLSSLGRVLRSSIEFTSQEKISLKEEIDFISDFLEVEQIKKTKDFIYELNVDASIEVDGIFIPPLLIQPLVENCLKHGFRKIQHQGKISIDITKNESQLIVKVIDNGRGLDQNKEIMHSTGLRNSIRRLDLLNTQQGGQNNSLEIKNRDEQDPGKGVVVTITLKVD